jgi:predicted transcriptional regulator of viral defense system
MNSVGLQLDQIASSQHGLITRTQVLGVGATSSFVAARVRSGEWAAISPGLYRLAGASRTTQQRILAACLGSGPEAVASHRSAAWLLGLLEQPPRTVEVTIARSTKPRRLDGVLVHRPADMPRGRPTRRYGIPTTTPERTLADLGGVLSPDALGEAVRVALRQHLATARTVEEELARRSRRGVPGVSALRAVMAEVTEAAIPMTVLERRAFALWQAGGLPRPRRELHTGSNGQYRVDFAWPWAGLIVEVDGYRAHGAPEAFQADRTRQNELVSEGWRILRYTWADVVGRPHEVTQQVRWMLDEEDRGRHQRR